MPTSPGLKEVRRHQTVTSRTASRFWDACLPACQWLKADLVLRFSLNFLKRLLKSYSRADIDQGTTDGAGENKSTGSANLWPCLEGSQVLPHPTPKNVQTLERVQKTATKISGLEAKI